MRRFLPLVIFTIAACSDTAPDSKSTLTDLPEPPAETATETTGTTETTASTATTASEVEVPSVQGPKLLPVDEGTSDPSFAKYREGLLEAVRARNTEAVVARSDKNIRTTFGDGGGSDALRKLLAQPGVWESLEQALELGGKFVGEGDSRSFWAPYVYSAWPDRHDAFESLVVTGERVPLRETADENGKVIATLTHDIVTRANPGSDLSQPFVAIRTADGRSGFVASSSVRSPVGYRAGFMQKNGEWKMNGFVAGD